MIQIQRVRSEQGTCMPWGISTESNLPPPTSLNQSPLGVYGRLLCGRVGFLRAQLWYIMITYYIHTLALLKTKTLSLSTTSTYTCLLYKTIIFYIISPPAIITISYFVSRVIRHGPRSVKTIPPPLTGTTPGQIPRFLWDLGEDSGLITPKIHRQPIL